VLNVIKDLLYENMTIDAYANKQLSRLNSIKESSQAVVAGSQAHRVLYTDKKGYGILEVWTIKGNNLYTIRCTSKPNDFSGHMSIFQKMIDSFEIA
jgi:hypothetical protein